MWHADSDFDDLLEFYVQLAFILINFNLKKKKEKAIIKHKKLKEILSNSSSFKSGNAFFNLKTKFTQNTLKSITTIRVSIHQATHDTTIEASPIASLIP
jgi:hypothetical protein